MHQHLVFDDLFFNRLSQRFPSRSRETKLYEFSRTVSSSLLFRSGLILKFVLCIPHDLFLHLYLDIDIWMKNITNNGVREVQLHNRTLSAYKIPSYLFSCSELTHLILSCCMFTQPRKFEDFRNLITVLLVGVIITTDITFGAQLTDLHLQRCIGIEHLGCQYKYYINLTFLSITHCGEIDGQWFGCTRKVIDSVLMLYGAAKSIVDLEELVDNMPRIRTLHLDGSFLKFFLLGMKDLRSSL
nr:PREDICTED: F-box/FBD/LRR-repeat protein At1g13570-like [Daucus carota subsp. sativus]